MEKLNTAVIGTGSLEDAMKVLQYRLILMNKDFTVNTALGPFEVKVDETGYTEYIANKYGVTYSITKSHNNNIYMINIKED